MQTPLSSSRVRFVLCDPSLPANIGAAARAIKTMGFRNLWVVNPKHPDYREHPDAIALSTSSVDVLRASHSVPTLVEALAGVRYAWALSGYDREFGPPIEDLRGAASKACDFLESESGDIAFVFGTERSGLTNEEIEVCQAVAAIPADPESTSLNLAQSVQVTAYELHMRQLERAGNPHRLYDWEQRFEHEPPAEVPAIEGLLRHWEQAMISCGALNPAEPKFLMPMTRRIVARAGLTQSEVDMLRGVCAAIIRPKAERKGMKKEKEAARKARKDVA
ncbi:MAG: RNA methyltransferase [Mesosutterella sp.]|nr:RNA methyltransferase [Mesosutterella sp.]